MSSIYYHLHVYSGNFKLSYTTSIRHYLIYIVLFTILNIFQPIKCSVSGKWNEVTYEIRFAKEDGGSVSNLEFVECLYMEL